MLDFGFYCMDCMDGMKEFPDKYFDLAIVDPPYGINMGKNGQPTRLNKYGSMRSVNDLRPEPRYFEELFRISKNQIVFGYNHPSDMLPPTKEFVFWYKHQPVDTYSDGELAWTSFSKTAKCFDYPYFGTTGMDDARISPAQKPVALYKWLIGKYAKDGDVILDTHVGSASSLIACRETGHKYVGFEIDKEYYEKAKQRLDYAEAQQNIFDYLRD